MEINEEALIELIEQIRLKYDLTIDEDLALAIVIGLVEEQINYEI